MENAKKSHVCVVVVCFRLKSTRVPEAHMNAAGGGGSACTPLHMKTAFRERWVCLKLCLKVAAGRPRPGAFRAWATSAMLDFSQDRQMLRACRVQTETVSVLWHHLSLNSETPARGQARKDTHTHTFGNYLPPSGARFPLSFFLFFTSVSSHLPLHLMGSI